MTGIHVFICMPYGDHNDVDVRLENTRRAMDVWHTLAGKFLFPFCPHLSHFLHQHDPKERNFWLNQSIEWVSKCDCVLAIGKRTPGMQDECLEARRLNKPVFDSIDQLLKAYGRV